MTPWGPCCHTQVSNSHRAASGSSLLRRMRRSTQASHIRLAQVMRALVVRTMSALSHSLGVATAAYVPTHMGPGSTKMSMPWRACLQRKGRSIAVVCIDMWCVRAGDLPVMSANARPISFFTKKRGDHAKLSASWTAYSVSGNPPKPVCFHTCALVIVCAACVQR